MKKIILILACMSLIFNESCNTGPNLSTNCFVPEVAVNASVNMSLPQYFHLQNIGEHMFLNGGNRGIFLVHNYDDAFYAIERTCVYQADNACSTIQVDSLNLQLRCGTYSDTGFVKCCESLYQLDGRLVNGPALCNLKAYRVSVQSNVIQIAN